MEEQIESAAERQAFLSTQPTYWLKRAYLALRRRVDGELRPFGLTLPQREALLALEHFGPMSQRELVRELGLEQSTVSRLIEGLTRRSLVEVRPGVADRRTRLLSISREGDRVLAATPGASKLAGTLIAEALRPAEIEQLIDLLARSARILEEPPSDSTTENIKIEENVS